jgi:hypothetical protein
MEMVIPIRVIESACAERPSEMERWWLLAGRGLRL